MTLRVGMRAGPYEVVSPLGAGGMGEVHRARDARLGRDVALKALPADLATDPHRLARFEREARLLAALSHPGIATLYGLERVDGVPVLVMELVEGPTLADRLRGGPLPVKEALEIARQIAQAVEAAHDKGIIHRDLKPSNIKLGPRGTVRLLDFGLGRMLKAETAEVSPVDEGSTDTGAVLGTAGYMSPEQAQGEEVDGRTDVWAFGCVLYEMLAGRRAFLGNTISEAVAAALRDEPDWGALPEYTPPSVLSLLRRCLQKDGARRLHDIADARIEIEETLADLNSGRLLATRAHGSALRTRRWLPLAATVALVLGPPAAWWLWVRARPPRLAGPPVRRFIVPFPEGTTLAGNPPPSMALSPDGETLAFVARQGGTAGLYVRTLGDWETKLLPNTDGAMAPFFSSDGQWLAFFTETTLKRVSLGGGTPQVICEAGEHRGARRDGTWTADGDLIFAGWPNFGVWRVRATGGRPELLTTPGDGGLVHYHHPQVLPGGRDVLVSTWTSGHARLEAFSLETRKRRTLLEDAASGVYLGSGHLVYAWENQILAVPFDVRRLAVSGLPVALVEGVRMSYGPVKAGDYALSANGTLLYAPGKPRVRGLFSSDRRGAEDPLPLPQGLYESPALSPDGMRVAVVISDPAGRDIWLGDLSRRTLSRLTFDGDALWPIWSPDGTRIVFSSSTPGQYNLFLIPAEGGVAERLTSSPNPQLATSWSPQGNRVLFNGSDAAGSGVWAVDVGSGRPPSLVLKGSLNATTSPDGRWIVYESIESGRSEVYVRSYPDLGRKRQVSADGGGLPKWSPDGRELFFQGSDHFLTVSFTGGSNPSIGRPSALFRVPGPPGRPLGAVRYSVSRDGKSFVYARDMEAEMASPRLHVVLNWVEELKRRVPSGR